MANETHTINDTFKLDKKEYSNKTVRASWATKHFGTVYKFIDQLEKDTRVLVQKWKGLLFNMMWFCNYTHTYAPKFPLIDISRIEHEKQQ